MTSPPQTSAASKIAADRPGSTDQIGLRLLRTIGFLSFYDRFATAPMIVVIAARAGVGPEGATLLVTVYAFAYAIGQPLWGILSDRVGRVRVLRIALVGAVVASALSTVAATFPVLLGSRAVAGLFVGALFPTVLTLIGDRTEGKDRVREVSALQTYTALGTTTATLVCGAVAVLTSWRVPFALTGVGALVVFWLTRGATNRVTTDAGRSPLGIAFTAWPLALYGIGVIEGGLLLGVFTFVAPVLHRDGVSPSVAGALAATYGFGIIAGSQLMRRAAVRTTVSVLIAIGGTLLTIAFAAAAVAVTSIVVVTGAAVLIGVSYSFLHGSLQTWATAIAPQARTTVVSLFIGSVFLGSSLATALASRAMAQPRIIFVVAVPLTAGLTVTAVALQACWRRRSQTTDQHLR